MAEALKEEGTKLFKDGDYKGARKKYKQAILMQPSAALYTNRAACYIGLNRLRDAIDDCEKALELDRTWSRAYVRKAETHLRLKEPEQASFTLTEGLKFTSASENKEMRDKMIEIQRKAGEMVYEKPSQVVSCDSSRDANRPFGSAFEAAIASLRHEPRSFTAEQTLRISELQKLEFEAFQGKEHESRGSITSAIKIYERCAENGITSSMMCLGEIYVFGRCGLPRDYNKAWYWLRRCADHGPSEFCTLAGIPDMPRNEALNMLGVMYKMGLGVEQDLDEAGKLFKEAAEGLCPDGMNNYANYLMLQKLDPGASEEALKWFKASAEAGSGVGMMNLARCYADGNDSVKTNLEMAEEWFRKAVDARQQGAALGLAKFLHATGRGSNEEVMELLDLELGSNARARDPEALKLSAKILLDESRKEHNWKQEMSYQGCEVPEVLSGKEERAIELLREVEVLQPKAGTYAARQYMLQC
jgi:TPR repeat protein